MAYSVEVSREAQAEIMESFVWKGENISVATAQKWYNGIIAALASLAEMPKRCPLAPEADAFSHEIRQLLHGKRQDTYRILFTVKAETVFVLHVRHSAMQTLQPEENGQEGD